MSAWADPPRPVIRLEVLTAPPSPQIKLVASLRPICSGPLTARALVGALVLAPLSARPGLSSDVLERGVWSRLPLGATLLLTSVRIAYQAVQLHYRRGLAVFARPEPIAGPGREWVGNALGGVWNDVQPGKDALGGSIGWQPESCSERWARRRFEARMGAVATERGICLRIASTDPRVPVCVLGSAAGSGRALEMYTRSARTWTGLLLAPSVGYALEMGSRTERWFVVSDEAVFCELWNGCGAESGWIGQVVGAMRVRMACLPGEFGPSGAHPQDDGSLALLLHVCLLYAVSCVERLVFGLARARFVDGDTPWRVWERRGRTARVGAGGIGSE
jgi:hypothetical protein